jgi:hypothetical protein
MKILDKANTTKNFSELGKGEVFKGNSNIYLKIAHCFSTVDIEDYLDYEGSMYDVNDLIDSYSGFNAVNLINGNLTFFDDFAKVTPLNTELHIL